MAYIYRYFEMQLPEWLCQNSKKTLKGRPCDRFDVTGNVTEKPLDAGW